MTDVSISKSRLWLGGGALGCVLLLVAGWFLLIQPKRADAAQSREALSSQQQANDRSRAKLDQLKSQFASLPAKRAELAKIRQAMPSDVAEASLQRELDTLAKGSGTTVLSVTDGDQTAFTAGASATTGASASSASSAADAENSTSSGGSTSSGAASGVSTMPVTISALSSFAGSQAFLQKLQDKMPRAFLVTGLNLSAQSAAKANLPKPATQNGDVLMTITGNVFILDTGAMGAASTAGATPTASSTAN